MKKLYIVTLTAEEQTTLTNMLKQERLAARRRQRAQILLLAHDGRTDAEIAQILRCGTATVERTRRKFVAGNLPAALTEQPRPGARRKLDGKAEAFLVATACSLSVSPTTATVIVFWVSPGAKVSVPLVGV